jgi:membrane protein DedA with SNARE-associated domain
VAVGLLLHGHLAHHALLPGWLLSPGWFSPVAVTVGHFVSHHQAVGLFLLVAAEELGIPLPVPGDVALAWAGYLTTQGAIGLGSAYAAVVGGATLGSFLLYCICRRYGLTFLLRTGRYIGLDPGRLEAAQRAFQRWGPWAIIVGRHIPGMRIVLSAFAGVFQVRARVFVPSVMVSSAMWAAIFLTLGRVLGRRSHLLFHLLPFHLLPMLVVALVLLALLYLGYERGWRARSQARRDDPEAWRRLDESRG